MLNFWSFFIQFVKFVKQVGSGDIIIEDNQVKDKDGIPIEEVAESWSSEFIQSEVCSRYSLLLLWLHYLKGKIK